MKYPKEWKERPHTCLFIIIELLIIKRNNQYINAHDISTSFVLRSVNKLSFNLLMSWDKAILLSFIDGRTIISFEWGFLLLFTGVENSLFPVHNTRLYFEYIWDVSNQTRIIQNISKFAYFLMYEKKALSLMSKNIIF